MKPIFTLAFLLVTLLGYAQPKFFRVMWNDDPSTTLVIGWSQDLVSLNKGQNFKVYYADQDFGTDTSAYAAVNSPVSPQRSVSAFKALDHHFTRLSGLKPNTAYYFVIAYENAAGMAAVSERFWTKTVSDNPDQPISIVAGGDSRLNVDGGPVALVESITIRQEANRVVSKLRPDMVAFGGDYTFANTEQEWIEWFQDWELTYTEDNKITPIVAAMGNHEASPFGCPDCGNFVVYNLFDTPHPDVYYAMSFGGNLLRMYTLNTEMAIAGEQSDWLNEDLDAHDLNTYWKMAQYHKPIRPHHSSKSDGNEAFDNWAEPFYEHQVRLVVECDAHVVKATWPLIPTRTQSGETECGKEVDHNFFRAENGRGITFVGEGTWAAIRTADDPKSWTRDMGDLNQVKWIWVSKNDIQVRTVRTYKADDTDYASNIEALSEENRFRVPQGVELWEPSNGSVVFINNNGLTPNPEPCATTSVASRELNKGGLLVFPNPTRNKTFKVVYQGAESMHSLQIVDAKGAVVFDAPFNASLEISLSSLKAGAYYARVQSKQGKMAIKKFILD